MSSRFRKRKAAVTLRHGARRTDLHHSCEIVARCPPGGTKPEENGAGDTGQHGEDQRGAVETQVIEAEPRQTDTRPTWKDGAGFRNSAAPALIAP